MNVRAGDLAVVANRGVARQMGDTVQVLQRAAGTGNRPAWVVSAIESWACGRRALVLDRELIKLDWEDSVWMLARRAGRP